MWNVSGNGAIPSSFGDLWVTDRGRQNAAFATIMEATSNPVPWAHDVWDEVVANLGHPDNHNRAIAAQILCNLAANDPTERVLANLDALVELTRDARFVTARHCLQSLWRIGAAGPTQRAAVIGLLERRYYDCTADRNTTLIRNDIIESMRHLHDATGDPAIETMARALIGVEPDPKYRRKYAGHWKVKT